MLLLGHAAVSARRGPRGTCQETRAAPWAPAECGVTARSASDGVDVNGIRVHHRRLQYRRYQCGVFAKVSPQILLRLRPRIVRADEERGCGGPFVPFAVSRLCRETSRHFGDGWRFWPLLPSVPVLWDWVPFWSASLFLMLDEMPHVFVRVHTRLINA